MRVQVDIFMSEGKPKQAHIFMRKVLKIKKEIKVLKEKVKEASKELHTEKYSTGSCFVSFKYKGDRDMFIDAFESTFLNTYVFPTKGFEYKGKSCNVYEASEPTDILWENLGQGFFTVLKRRIYTYIASFCLIGVSLAIVLLFKSYQVKLREERSGLIEDEKGLGYKRVRLILLSWAVSFCLVSINICLNNIMKLFCKIERHSSTTTFNLSFVKKLVRVQLINSCGLIILSHFLLIEDSKLIWLEGGLIYDAFFLILSKLFMFIVAPLLDFPYYIKLFQRWKLRKYP